MYVIDVWNQLQTKIYAFAQYNMTLKYYSFFKATM